MSARRVTKSAIDWAAFGARLPPQQAAVYKKLKSEHEKYLTSVHVYPENLPTIDWSKYERVAVPGMAETFKKSYEKLAIPYPKDTISQKYDTMLKEWEPKHQEVVKQVREENQKFQDLLAEREALIDITEMTKEEYFECYPHMAHDFQKVLGEEEDGDRKFPREEGAKEKIDWDAEDEGH